MAIRLTTYEHACDVPDLPGNNLFHSLELFHILEQTSGFHPLMMVAYENNLPVGKLLCTSRHLFSFSDLYDKLIIYGNGEYFNTNRRPDEIFSEMLSYLTSRFTDRVFFIEFRNLEEPLFAYRYFRENGYFPVRWLRVRNSLYHDTIDEWMSSSRRRQIQKGLKNGAVLDVVKTKEELNEFFPLMKGFYLSKVDRYMPEVNFFQDLFLHNVDRKLGELFTVRYHGRLIGGAVCLFSGDTAYLVLSGGLRKRYPTLHPGSLAVWNAMCYARDKGFKYFEFFNAGLPFKKFGYRDFILRFGGKQFGTRRWYRMRWNWLNKLLIKFYV